MAQKSIFVIIFPNQLKKGLNGFGRLEFSQGHGGMKADPQGRILEQGNQRFKGGRVSRFTEYLGRLGADFRIPVLEELKQRSDAIITRCYPTPPPLSPPPPPLEGGAQENGAQGSWGQDVQGAAQKAKAGKFGTFTDNI